MPQLRPRILLCLAFAFAFGSFIARDACAQGGPPMITDDPGTPGNGHWENNIAVAFEHRPNEISWDLPAIVSSRQAFSPC